MPLAPLVPKAFPLGAAPPPAPPFTVNVPAGSAKVVAPPALPAVTGPPPFPIAPTENGTE